jgi:hypothetical protein
MSWGFQKSSAREGTTTIPRDGDSRGANKQNTKTDHAKEKARGTQIKTPSPKEADPCFQTEESPIRVQPQTGSQQTKSLQDYFQS